MQEQDAQRLLEKFRACECTEEEKTRLRNWFHTINAELPSGLSEDELEATGRDMWAELEIQTKPRPVRRLWPKIAAAASILLILSVGTYLIINNKKTVIITHDVAPFTAMAILKTRGKTIVLDKTQNGKIAQTVVSKSEGEQLTYSTSDEVSVSVYDTIQIPAGGRPYTVKLSDGSKIILNAATTLRYPESFSKNKREPIELISGEIYAEIVHNTGAPLTIKAPDQLIDDIGTEFNISAYKDEPDRRTTLVEGAVKVNNRALKPGQQSILENNELTITTADIEQVTAWKDGDFNFRGQHIDVIMRQLARWYNIEVRYEGKMTDEVFYGTISRKKNISQVLHTLERKQKIHFKIEGRRVTVLNKK
jgi:transmembrane sensor